MLKKRSKTEKAIDMKFSFKGKEYKKIIYDFDTDPEDVTVKKRLVDILCSKCCSDEDAASDGFTRIQIQEMATDLYKEVTENLIKKSKRLNKEQIQELRKKYTEEFIKKETAKKRTLYKKGLLDEISELCIPETIEGLIEYHFRWLLIGQSSFSKEIHKILLVPIKYSGEFFWINQDKTKYTVERYDETEVEERYQHMRSKIERELILYRGRFSKARTSVYAELEGYPSIISYMFDSQSITKADEDIVSKITSDLYSLKLGEEVIVDNILSNNCCIIVFLNTSHESFKYTSRSLKNLFCKKQSK